MITAKERKQRHAMRVLRVDVLNAIDKLEAERCDNCRESFNEYTPISKIRCDCDASVKIRKLANLL